MNSVLQRWSGPLLALPGLLGIAVLLWQAPGERSTTAWWILASALSVERLVPLIGLGIALSLLDRWQSWAALVMFLAGTVLGFDIRPWFTAVLVEVPRAADHLFLTGPLSNVAAGVLLIAPRGARAWLFAPVMLFAGAMLAVAIGLTNPTIGDLLIPCAGVVVGAWIISAVALTASAFHHAWFAIGARIVGSWLLAAGLLYGSASFVPRPAPPPLPVAPPQPGQPAPFKGFGNGSQGLELKPEPPSKPSGPHI
jgi:hypothetical protein